MPPVVKDQKERILKPDDIARISSAVLQGTGIDLRYYKAPTISRRLSRRYALSKVSSVDEYLTLLKQDKSEIRALCEDTLVQVTSFFRDSSVFATLCKKILPDTLENLDDSGI